MDIFCKPCASKPNWPFDDQAAFFHACQRCFMYLPCNDYSWRKTSQGLPATPGAAPMPKELVRTQVNPQAQADLPRAGVPPTPVPQPVYPVSPPQAQAMPTGDGKALTQDELLERLQGPEKKGIKLQRLAGKGGNPAPEPGTKHHAAVADSKLEEPKIEVAD